MERHVPMSYGSDQVSVPDSLSLAVDVDKAGSDMDRQDLDPDLSGQLLPRERGLVHLRSRQDGY